jgi:hypothetical protein
VTKKPLSAWEDIAQDRIALLHALSPVVNAVMTTPANTAAVKGFTKMLAAQGDYPSDMFRAEIDHIIFEYDANFLPNAARNDRPALERHREIFAGLAARLETAENFPPQQSEAELRSLGIKFSRRADGMLEVADKIDLTGKKLGKLPDLSNVVVLGDFSAGGNDLKDIVGAPAFVGGTATFAGNTIKSLAEGPQYVGVDFVVSSNNLNDLHGSPLYVGRDYEARQNLLTTLAGTQPGLNGVLSLKGNFRLVSFEHGPRVFEEMQTDFGIFKTWDDIPENFRVSQATRDKQAQDFREMMDGVEKHTGVLSRAVPAPKTARFTRK